MNFHRPPATLQLRQLAAGLLPQIAAMQAITRAPVIAAQRRLVAASAPFISIAQHVAPIVAAARRPDALR